MPNSGYQIRISGQVIEIKCIIIFFLYKIMQCIIMLIVTWHKTLRGKIDGNYTTHIAKCIEDWKSFFDNVHLGLQVGAYSISRNFVTKNLVFFLALFRRFPDAPRYFPHKLDTLNLPAKCIWIYWAPYQPPPPVCAFESYSKSMIWDRLQTSCTYYKSPNQSWSTEPSFRCFRSRGID